LVEKVGRLVVALLQRFWQAKKSNNPVTFLLLTVVVLVANVQGGGNP